MTKEKMLRKNFFEMWPIYCEIQDLQNPIGYTVLLYCKINKFPKDCYRF